MLFPLLGFEQQTGVSSYVLWVCIQGSRELSKVGEKVSSMLAKIHPLHFR